MNTCYEVLIDSFELFSDGGKVDKNIAIAKAIKDVFHEFEYVPESDVRKFLKYVKDK